MFFIKFHGVVNLQQHNKILSVKDNLNEFGVLNVKNGSFILINNENKRSNYE